MVMDGDCAAQSRVAGAVVGVGAAKLGLLGAAWNVARCSAVY